MRMSGSPPRLRTLVLPARPLDFGPDAAPDINCAEVTWIQGPMGADSLHVCGRCWSEVFETLGESGDCTGRDFPDLVGVDTVIVMGKQNPEC